MGYPNMTTSGGRRYREDGSVVNEANYLAPVPNGGEVLTVAAAGVVALTVPTGTIQATITNTVDIRIAFGTAASATVGTLFPAKSCPVLNSAEQLAAASVYFTAADAGAYVQYWG